MHALAGTIVALEDRTVVGTSHPALANTALTAVPEDFCRLTCLCNPSCNIGLLYRLLRLKIVHTLTVL